MSITARDIDRYMRRIGPFVDWTSTCDTFKTGEPDSPVHAIAVSWMSTLDNLREAHERGCNLFITHEPTFYSHMDDDPVFDDDACTKTKRAFLADTGMIIYRCHDVWDRYPREGILDTWAAALGLTATPVAGETFMRVVPIEPMPARAFAEHLAAKVAPFGQEAVPVVGDPDQPVTRIGIGTGAICSGRDYVRMGADAGIVTEITWWRDARWFQDMGVPLFVVDHTVSEEPGMMSLAEHLDRAFAEVRVEYLPTQCPYRLIGPG